MVDSLADGSLFAELQISAWPPAVTQTLLRKSDGQRTLTVRGKPSGRLRITLEREGYQPIVVRTVHLRLRAPTILKVNVAWRETDMVVAAAGQVIGSSREFDPLGVAAPAEVEQTAARPKRWRHAGWAISARRPTCSPISPPWCVRDASIICRAWCAASARW